MESVDDLWVDGSGSRRLSLLGQRVREQRGESPAAAGSPALHQLAEALHDVGRAVGLVDDLAGQVLHVALLLAVLAAVAPALPPQRRGRAGAGTAVLHVALQAGEGGRALPAAHLLARGLGAGARRAALGDALGEGHPQAVQGAAALRRGLLHAAGRVREVGAVEISPLLVLRNAAPIVLPRDDGRVTAFHGRAGTERSLHPVRLRPAGGREGERRVSQAAPAQTPPPRGSLLLGTKLLRQDGLQGQAAQPWGRYCWE